MIVKPAARPLFFVLACLASGTTATVTKAATVDVTVTDIEPDGHDVYASLCSGGLGEGFCKNGIRQPASRRTITFRFSGIAPGSYAFVAFQDAGGTGTLERSKLGLPLVPFAMSNNMGRTRRPSFEQASFRVGEGGTSIRVQMHMLSQAAPR